MRLRPAIALHLRSSGAGAPGHECRRAASEILPRFRTASSPGCPGSCTPSPTIVAPWRGGAAICRWPGPLALIVENEGARFEQRFFLDRDGEVQLPGSPTLWPQGVQVNGKAVVVLQEGEQPVVRLPIR